MVLKLLGIIFVSWWLVAAPVLIMAAWTIVVLAVMLVIAALK